MYIAIYLILLAIGGIFIYSGATKKKKGRIWAGAIWVLLTFLFFGFMRFWGNKLWFDAIGYSDRFWIEFAAKGGMLVGGAIICGLITFILSLSIPKDQKIFRYLTSLVGTIFGGYWGFNNWYLILKYINKVDSGIYDPILKHDASFYMFSLPFFKSLYFLLVVLFIISLIGYVVSLTNLTKDQKYIDPKEYRKIYLIGAMFIILLAAGKFLQRYNLMYSSWGTVSGPGWTDVNIRLPMYLASVGITILAGLLLLFPNIRKRSETWIDKLNIQNPVRWPVAVASHLLMVFIAWFILLTIIPGLFQWLRVEPNEITMEKPFISNNIEFTKHGFRLQDVEEREFPANENFTPEMVAKNKNIFENIRLWDWRALDAVYKQFQEIRLYYEFVDVDIDRYTFDSSYNLVMVSAREMEQDNLPAQSRTFVNQRFKYTHGYGITLTKVSEFTENGLPNLLVRDIPPKSKYKELEVKYPEIYYGELSNEHVVVNSKEKEFDFPSGEENVYIQYDGQGGVQMSNIWRKFLYGWMFDRTRFFLSGYPTKESRIMFKRNIRERVNELAPFLKYDEDPYITLVDGKLYWIIDAYTTSSFFPYSEPFMAEETIEYKEGNTNQTIRNNLLYQFRNANYVRNSVKVIVDAYNGSIDFYIFEEDDPIIQVYDKIYPGMFKPRSEMPDELEKHVRYPIDMLLLQGLVYAKYHMNDPAVFYNQEDLWIRATEKYYNQVQPVEPYYVMWEMQDEDDPEFALIMPFTPKNRQVLIGWIAGLCDNENYGRFIAYKFPKEKRILGPQQVETKIDQDSYLSGQLTLWDQRGSSVIRGNVLAIPVENTIIYVEPIYLQSETAAYPELRLVAIMHNDKLSYAESFDKALEGLFKDQPVRKSQARGQQKKPEGEKETKVKTETKDQSTIQNANDAFNRYLEYTGKGEFDKASEALKELQGYLKELEIKEEK